MIVSNRKHMFGLSHFGVVKWPTATTGCAVCTAPEGLFKGCSTIFYVFEGDEWSNAATSKLRPIAKVWLSPTLSKAQRTETHALILNRLDAAMFIDGNVEKAVSETVKAMEERGAAVHSTFAPSDTPLTVEQIKSAETATAH